MNKYILITAGRGPVECGLAVQGIQRKFREFLDDQNIKYEIVNQQKGPISRSMNSIIFKTSKIRSDSLDQWIGSIQWICKSPIRKYNKRKNWYVKCIEIELTEKRNIDIKAINIQTFRASGPGGQHRNKVETAVRITHLPTGLIVTATDSKSQLQNKKNALEKMKLRLEQYNNDMMNNFNTDKWANQIEIERGNPVKTFKGMKFIEMKNDK